MKRIVKIYSLVVITLLLIGSSSVFGRFSDSMPAEHSNLNFPVDFSVINISFIQIERSGIEKNLQNQTISIELSEQLLTNNVKFIPGQSFVWRKNSIRSLIGFKTHLKI
jgi:hypothetical protein